MSEAEFDSYLSLMAKFLRLRSRQKDALADELRDHLESRLDELLAQGKTREQAVSIALEEFGDAAVLAEDFSRLASRHTRRFVMRCTAASAVVVAAVVLLTLAVAPPVPDGAGLPPLVAQDAAPGGEPATEAVPSIPETPSIQQEAIAALDAKLDKVIPEINFVEQPLKEVLELIADKIEADVLIDQKALENEGVAPDQPVSLQLTRTPVAARTVLEFVLEPNHLAFVNRSGVLFITTQAEADELLTTKVYNVRDLLGNTSSNTMPPQVMDAPGMESDGFGMGMMPGGGRGGMARPTLPPLVSPANELIGTIQQTTSGPWMDRDGAGGTLTVFNGLLVVRQTEPVHAEIQKLLDALREAAGQQPGSSVTVPKDSGTSPKPDGRSGVRLGTPPKVEHGDAGFGAPGISRTDSGDTPPGASSGRKGLGARFAEYRPTPEMRQMFLQALTYSDSGDDIGQHKLLAMLLTVPGPAQSVFQNSGIDTKTLEQIRQRVSSDEPIGDLDALLNSAEDLARKDTFGAFDSGHLLVALLDKGKDGPLREVLAQMGLNAEQVKDRVAEWRKASRAEERNPLQIEPRKDVRDIPPG